MSNVDLTDLEITAPVQAEPIEIITDKPAGALSPVLQSIARNYLATRARAGQAILESARYLAEARAAAKYGEWKVFLEATGTQEDTATRMLAIAERADADPQYARAISDGRLALTAAFEILSAPAETQQRALESDTPTSISTIRAEKQTAKLRNVAEFESPTLPADLIAAGVQLVKHGAWWQPVGFSGELNGWVGKAEPWDLAVSAAREETERRAKPKTPDVVPPDLADTFKRLSAHGYDRTGTPRQKGITTYYTFRDRASDLDDDSTGVIELAEGELSFWLAELDDNARRAEARQAAYLDARDRFQTLGWRLERDGKAFALYQPSGKHHGVTTQLEPMIKTLEALERDAAKRPPADGAAHLPAGFRDEQKRAERIGLALSMDMRGVFSLRHAQSGRVEQIDAWGDVQRYLDTAEQMTPARSAHAPALSIDLQTRLVAAGAAIGSNGTVYAPRRSGETPAVLTETEAEAALLRWAAIKQETERPTEDQQISQGAKRRAIGLLKQLEPLMQLIKTEDFEGLSAAIDDLNSCEEGTEADHWLKVGYAICDVEP